MEITKELEKALKECFLSELMFGESILKVTKDENGNNVYEVQKFQIVNDEIS